MKTFQKLALLLLLPNQLNLVKARITLVRLTVPADLYTNGILIEIEGVDVQIEVSPECEDTVKPARTQQKRRGGLAKGTRANRSRSTQPIVHDPGGSSNAAPYYTGESQDGESSHIPTTVDLAKSFLQAEPDHERAELRANVVKSQPLQQTQLSEDGDEGVDTGVGMGISLPGFLADFLMGVRDRLQIQIRGIQIDVDFKIEVHSAPTTASVVSSHAEPVTCRLLVENVKSEVVVSNPTLSPACDPMSDMQTALNPMNSLLPYRRFSLTNIRGQILSDASLLTSLSNLSGPSSPVVTHSSAFRQKLRQTPPTLSETKSGSSSSSAGLAMTQSTILQSPAGSPSSSSQLEASVTTSDGDRFADAAGPDDMEYAENAAEQAKYQPSPEDKDYFGFDSAEDEEGDRAGNGAEKKSAATQLSSQHVYTGKLKDPELDEVEDLIKSSQGRLKHDQASENGQVLHLEQQNEFISVGSLKENLRENVESVKGKTHTGSPFDSTSLDRPSNHSFRSSPSITPPIIARQSHSPPDDDLTHSKIYSHDEAQSLYMSAFSHVSLSDTPEQSVIANLVDFTFGTDEAYSAANDSHIREEVFDCRSSSSKRLYPVIYRSKLENIKGNHKDDKREGLDAQSHSRHLPVGLKIQPSAVVYSQSSTVEEPDASQASNPSSPQSERPSRVVKQFLNIKEFVLDNPQKTKDVQPQGTSNKVKPQSTSRRPRSFEIPGAFSASISQFSQSTIQADSRYDPHRNTPYTKVEEDESTNRLPARSPTSIVIRDISLISDLALLRLIVTAMQQVSTLKLSDADPPHTSDEQELSSGSLVVQVDKLSWKIVDNLHSVIESASPKVDEPAIELHPSENSETLLSVAVVAFDLSRDYHGSSSRTELSIGTFTFGYDSDSIISFEPESKEKQSIHDEIPFNSRDIRVTILQSPRSKRVQVTTLPLRVTLDLARLDETFSWFGGLNSVLGLGSSMMSSMTIIDTKSKTPHNGTRTHGVRFETPGGIEHLNDSGESVQYKIESRFGGAVFELRGKASALRLESTAVKLVSRAEYVAVQVDGLILSGPHLRELHVDPTVSAQLRNVRIEYLSNPKEVDLDRLLALLSPSRDKYEPDDDILLETLLRQRRQGGVIRITVETLEGNVSSLHEFERFSMLGEELTKLSTVTKYLPEDDRPGILTLALVRNFNFAVHINSKFGFAKISSQNIELAHVGLPSLVLLGVTGLHVSRGEQEELVGEAIVFTPTEVGQQSPVIMIRLIGDELEPTIKIKLWNIRFEYHVSTVMAILGLSESAIGEIIVSDLISSVATLTGIPSLPKLTSQTSSNNGKSSTGSKVLRYDIAIRDSTIGLNPRKSPSKAILILASTKVAGMIPNSAEASINSVLEVHKASLMVIDDVDHVTTSGNNAKEVDQDGHISTAQLFAVMGYVSISEIAAAKVTLHMISSDSEGDRSVDVEIRNDLFVLESCADSTQTLINVLNGLKPPSPPNVDLKYRTEVIPVQDMLASFSGDAFETTSINSEGNEDFTLETDEEDMVDDEVPQNLEFVSSFYNPDPTAAAEAVANSILEDDLNFIASAPVTRNIGDKRLLESFQEQYEVAPGSEPLDFREDHFGSNSTYGGIAHRWSSDRNTYNLSNEFKIPGSSLKVRVRDVHIIWNLFDGYDWQRTRDTISQAVADVEKKAVERLSRKGRRKPQDIDEEEDSVIGDFLFNSIYIGVPANRNPRDLARQVNRNIDDLTSETGSYATSTTVTSSPSRQSGATREKRAKLRLARSKRHKMTFELKGVSIDLVVFPPESGETQNSINVRVQDLDIFDHITTSTWRKFATYMHDAGERESGSSMVHIEILKVKPVPDLAASEIILKVSPR